MRIYWYSPFAREEDAALLPAVVRPGDDLVVQTLDRPGTPASGPTWRVVADLPEVEPKAEGSPGWYASRAATYGRRVWLRRRLLAAERPDVCHVLFQNRFTDAVDLPLLARRVPLVSTIHDVVPHHRRLPGRAEDLLLRLLYRGRGTVVVTHEHLRRRLASDYGLDPARVAVVPLPVPPAAPSAAPDGPPTVLFFGTFRRNKGIAVLLDAAERLRDRTDVRFHLAGRGAPEEEARAREAAARDPRVTAEIGWVAADRKAALYAGARLVVLPYTSFASQSAVLHDAYAHRVPVVVSDVGALGESVREDRTGWVVPPGDPAALAAAVDAALGDGNRWDAARAAIDEVAARRSPEAVGRTLRALYDRVVEGR